MTHNEVSAMYRAVLGAVGLPVDVLSTSTRAGKFFDQRIYEFADRYRGYTARGLRAPLLRHALNSLHTTTSRFSSI